MEAGEGDDSFELGYSPGALSGGFVDYFGDFIKVRCSLPLELFAMPEDVCSVGAGALALWVVTCICCYFPNVEESVGGTYAARDDSFQGALGSRVCCVFVCGVFVFKVGHDRIMVKKGVYADHVFAEALGPVLSVLTIWCAGRDVVRRICACCGLPGVVVVILFALLRLVFINSFVEFMKYSVSGCFPYTLVVISGV